MALEKEEEAAAVVNMDNIQQQQHVSDPPRLQGQKQLSLPKFPRLRTSMLAPTLYLSIMGIRAGEHIWGMGGVQRSILRLRPFSVPLASLV
jgi:hypothetical protein